LKAMTSLPSMVNNCPEVGTKAMTDNTPTSGGPHPTLVGRVQ
jgi:hypothetical protein